MTDKAEGLGRLLDQFKRYSQQAGIAQQKAVADAGSQDDTVAWLDKAEAKRAEILEWVRLNRPTVNLSDLTATTTHPNVLPR